MKKFASIAVISLLTTAACQGQGGYNDNRQTYQGAGLGAIVGAATGALTGKGSTDRRQRALAGAGIGAVAGGGYGAYMDNQEAEFRRSLSGKGVQIQRVGDELVLTMPDNITFDTGSSALKPNFVYTLNNVSDVLKSYNQTQVNVTGHTDSTGSAELNQELSERRAQAVANVFRSNGILGQRLYVFGAGENQPVASNQTESGKAANRRVEVRISPVKQSNLFGL